MKLRSGRELPERIDKLPEDLDSLLEDRLQEFKTLFSNNPQHANELLKIISKAISIEIRFAIRDKLEEITDPQDRNTIIKRDTESEVAGSLARVLIYNPQYHDIIEDRIKNFDLETPLLGNVEE